VDGGMWKLLVRDSWAKKSCGPPWKGRRRLIRRCAGLDFTALRGRRRPSSARAGWSKSDSAHARQGFAPHRREGGRPPVIGYECDSGRLRGHDRSSASLATFEMMATMAGHARRQDRMRVGQQRGHRGSLRIESWSDEELTRTYGTACARKSVSEIDAHITPYHAIA